MILDQSQISMNVGRITVGDSQGTVFLVSDDVAVTASHVIADNNKEILLEFLNVHEEIIKVVAKRIQVSESQSDVTFLKLANTITGFEHLSFSAEVLPNNVSWVTFGYPAVESLHGMFITGTVEQIKTTYNPCDYNMILRYNGQEFNTEGTSGSPVFVNGYVVGVITDDKGTANLLGAFACDIFKEELNSLNLSKMIDKEKTDRSIIMKNETTRTITKTIERIEKGYIFIKGQPGSGKSFIAKRLNDKELDAVIIGKYFVEDNSDNLGIEYKAAPTIFGKWIVNSISKELYFKYIEEKEYGNEKLVELINDYMTNLSEVAKRENKKYVFILDGIDAVARNQKQKVVDLFRMLPRSLYERIIFVIFGNDENILPQAISQNFCEDNFILMQPILDEQIVLYFKEKLNLDNPDYEELIALTKLSEGNPLYIYYIIEHINSLKDIDLHSIIDNFPAFNGEIENYYESIWNVIKEDELSIKLAAIIARVRYSIDIDLLVNVFDFEERIYFDNAFANLNYLMNTTRGIEFYHSSFSLFVVKKTTLIGKDINKLIAYACEGGTSKYSLENQLYHLSKGCEKDIEKAIQLCNQDWIDKMALFHTNPDIILIDVKDILNHAVDRKSIGEIVRIHLLIQRLKFRNEKMFREYAFEMANALLNNKFYDEALYYLIREDILTIGFDETLHMIRSYMLAGRTENALFLDKTLQRKCIKEYETREVSNIAIMADISSTALMRQTEFGRRLQLFGTLLNQSEYDDAEEMMSIFVADAVGYAMWNEDQYASVLDIDEEHFKLCDDTVVLVLNIVNSYLVHENNFYRKNSSTFRKAISDLEELCNTFEVSREKEIALILVKYGSDENLLNNLLNEIEEENFELRNKNGVDINIEKIHSYYNYCLLKSNEKFDLDSIIIDDVEWEEKLENIVLYVSSIEGLCWKAKREDDRRLGNDAINILIQLIRFFKFDLKNRAEWDRSYSIPEHVMPFIWSKITFIMQVFGREYLNKYIDDLIDDKQLGLYSEGYRRSLFEVVFELNRNNDLKMQSIKVLSKLEKITEEFVENRWERTRDFLRLISEYGKIGAYEKASTVYSKMLETSMGPSWYKESQMSLMGHVIKCLPFFEGENKYLIESLANLDYASGEMTFQRYIRDEKEAFVGIIYKCFGLTPAIEYYKSLVLPEPVVILNNSDKNSMDKIEEGVGYVQGTKEIDFQDGILSLIDSLEDTTFEILWALSEIFIQGDDRYFYRFSQLQSYIINEVEKNDDKLFFELSNRVERQYVAEFDNTRRNYYLKELQIADVNKELVERLRILTNLETLQFTSFARYKDDDIQHSNDASELMQEFDLQIQLGNQKVAKDLLVKELNKVHEKGFSISNYSATTNLSLDLINKYAESSEEVLELLNQIIKNPFGHEEWILIETIIDVTGNKLNEEQATEILEIIMEHFHLILRTPNDAKHKYEWLLESAEQCKDNDFIIFEFILWLSNLPDMVNIRERVFDVALWLVTYNSDKYFIILIENIINESDYTVKEFSCAILRNIAQTDLIVQMCQKVSDHDRFVNYISDTNDFLVLSTFYEIFRKCNERHVNENYGVYETIKYKLFRNEHDETKRYKNSIANIAFASNSSMVESLNELVRFTIDDIQQIADSVKCSSPLSVKDMKKVENMIERSYHVQRGSSKVCERILLNSMNNVITKYVNYSNYQHIVEILRKYNPNSPEPNVGEERPNIFEKVVSTFNGESVVYNDCIIHDNSYILHFHEAVENEDRFDRVEIIAFLCDEFDIEKVSEYRKYNSFYINTDPADIDYDDCDETMCGVPLINKPVLTNVYGSMYTPAEICCKGDVDVKLSKNIIKRSWREGKCLDVYRFGMPQKEGAFLTVEKEILDEIRKERNLIFEINYNSQIYYLDYDRKIVY